MISRSVLVLDSLFSCNCTEDGSDRDRQLTSRYGVVSYADSLDCVGILGKSVDTVQQVFGT